MICGVPISSAFTDATDVDTARDNTIAAEIAKIFFIFTSNYFFIRNGPCEVRTHSRPVMSQVL